MDDGIRAPTLLYALRQPQYRTDRGLRSGHCLGQIPERETTRNLEETRRELAGVCLAVFRLSQDRQRSGDSERPRLPGTP